MTYEEAANAIKTWVGPMRKAHQGNEFANEFIDCAEFMTRSVVREAVEKQIPKKPVRDKDWYFSLLCPCCNRKIADTEHLWDIQRKYLEEQEFRCPCGQALNWSDDEET